MPALTIHHLTVSQSERIPWLCEELHLPYTLRTYRRSLILAPPAYRALHPSGAAPVIHDANNNLTLAESGACIEYLCHSTPAASCFSSPAIKTTPRFCTGGTSQTNKRFAEERVKRALEAVDIRLRDHTWLAGSEFTAADIMTVFSLTTMRYFYPYSLAEYKNILRYQERVGERKAYQKAMRRCDPDMELVLGAEPPKKLMMPLPN
ncbi:glutathione S-transferase 3 [Podospora australis]|uniref:Glutathione S-transferase 3 n=1 Tax=Podospora australis TaxID=1536484 RepID=A0AAN6WYL7_9PEZI|nr:glutathione S-transferase 3 [Podospora australis]